jgi:hypothetical protein
MDKAMISAEAARRSAMQCQRCRSEAAPGNLHGQFVMPFDMIVK